MTTTDPYGGWAPPAATPPTGGTGGPDNGPRRLLRRSTTDRMGAGVAGGLGDYFGVDPVLFRVLFATSAFFGGVGIIAYLLAWAAIPEQGAAHGLIDRWIGELRRHRIPVWCVAVVAGLVVWGIGFSWWAPRPFVPLLIVAIVIIALVSRHESRHRSTPAGTEPVAVDLTKSTAPIRDGAVDPAPPQWLEETRRWRAEAKAQSRARRRRSRPVLLVTWGALLATLATLALCDAVGGIVISAYFWALAGIVLAGLLTGLALRRTPWSMTPLLIPGLAGIVAFAGTGASISDGIGQQDWTPTTSLQSSYRLGIGQGVLDLRSLAPLTTDRAVDVTVGAGQLQVLLPTDLNATVDANLHIGEISIDGQDVADSHGPGGHRDDGGFGLSRTVPAPTGAIGPHLQITLHLTDGEIAIRHG